MGSFAQAQDAQHHFNPGGARPSGAWLLQNLGETHGIRSHPDSGYILEAGNHRETGPSGIQPIFDYFGYDAFDCELLSDHEIKFNPGTGELSIYTNGDVTSGFASMVKDVAKNLGKLSDEADYFILSDYDTADIDNAREKIYFGPSKKAIEALKTQEDVDEAMSLLAGHLDDELVASLRETVDQALGGKVSHHLSAENTEKVLSVLMQDIVGDYDTPDQVPEWSWVERVASYAHAKNGQEGVWEFVLNLSSGWDDTPERFIPVINKAKADSIAYMIVHQGT